jgi:hypothetical protein
VKIDLYKTHKKFYQRWYRDKDNVGLLEIKDLSHDLVKYLYLHRDGRNWRFVKSRALELAKCINQLEITTGFETLFSCEFIEAIKTNSFTIELPYPVDRRWNPGYSIGQIYIMTAKTRPGICKLGATTLSIDDRLAKYRQRYKYEVQLYFCKYVSSPFIAEKEIADKILDLRLTGRDYLNTNEWYRIKPNDLKKIIISHVS